MQALRQLFALIYKDSKQTRTQRADNLHECASALIHGIIDGVCIKQMCFYGAERVLEF